MRATIWMGYFKQGDDLAHHLREEETSAEAFKCHAAQMRCAADRADAVGDFLKGKGGIEVDADVHHIGVSGPDDVISELVGRGLAELDECEYDEGT